MVERRQRHFVFHFKSCSKSAVLQLVIAHLCCVGSEKIFFRSYNREGVGVGVWGVAPPLIHGCVGSGLCVESAGLIVIFCFLTD